MALHALCVSVCADTKIPRCACAAVTRGFLPPQGDSVPLLRPLADWMRPIQTIEGPLLYLKSASFGHHCIYTTPLATPRLPLMVLPGCSLVRVHRD